MGEQARCADENKYGSLCCRKIPGRARYYRSFGNHDLNGNMISKKPISPIFGDKLVIEGLILQTVQKQNIFNFLNSRPSG
jgi:hypothetical protein